MLKKLTSLYLLLSWTILFAQNDSVVKYDESELQPIELSSEELDSYRNDSDFNYEEVKTENGWWTDIVNWFYNILRRFFEWIFGVGNAEGYLAAFLKILPYLLLALFLYLVIRFFVKSNILGMGNQKKNPNMVTLSEDEHIIKNEDIQELIKKALTDENYRLAIRYYYLYILQLLSERELIDWQQQKTNDDYMAELSDSSFKNDFGKATLLYDYVWYGEFELNQERYQKAELVFASLKKSIADVKKRMDIHINRYFDLVGYVCLGIQQAKKNQLVSVLCIPPQNTLWDLCTERCNGKTFSRCSPANPETTF